MSRERTAGTAARSAGLGAARVLRAWRLLPYERRLAAGAALGLFVTLFLPWYQETVVATDRPTPVGTSVTGWAAFSFVEAAVLLVAVGVLTLLFMRAEGRAFHLPGGDGWVIMLSGGWTCALVVWRIFDKQGTTAPVGSANKSVIALGSSGIEWGILVALGVAGCLTYAGSRIRAAHQPEPPLPGDAVAPAGGVVLSPPARTPRAEPALAEAPETAPATPPRPAPATPPRPVPARPPQPVPARPAESGSASDRRTGWLTARPEGWVENPDTARREPTRSWSYADDLVGEPAPDDPPTAPKPDAPDVAEPRTTRITRRRKRPPDDQLTIKLDRDNDV